MNSNLKKRIYTSVLLLFLLLLMIMNNLILGYLLLILGIFSFLEFSAMIKIIFKKKKLQQFTNNLLFILYIFLFCGIFLILSFHLQLKILIFLILVICVASDIGGYVFGKIFKGKKLTKISPNKTISGSIGSLVFSGGSALIIVYYLTDKIDFFILIVALVTSIASQLGDLFFSFIKRKSKLEDTGKYLPGHGGILDRIDGILLGVPIGLLTMWLIY